MEGIDLSLTINNVWMMLCIALVFIMHAGFSMLEIGLTRSKNTVNILFKNVLIVSIGLLTYAAFGFNLMYPGEDFAGTFFGFAGFGLHEPLTDNGLDLAYNGGYTYWTDFLFQGMFAATAATIVSGAVAERIKLEAFILFSIVYVGLVYPIVGMWQWGGGWLNAKGFHDFAGSTIVHGVGGWGALISIFLLGPRLGKYNGTVVPIEGHNLPLATLGVFLLWFGWFGFNGGSVLSADAATTSKVLVTTCLAAAAGSVTAVLVAFLRYKTYDLTMGLNGILAGLVGITAGADLMSPMESIIIGIIAGIIVVYAISTMDKLRLDDPVGAVPVHLICGIWGTLAVGILGDKSGWSQLVTQLIGVVSVGAFCCLTSYLIFYVLKKTIGIRVSERDEVEGLDIHEHQMEAYPDFRMNSH